MMEFILSHVEKGVMTLTLNRPERLNSFNDEMHAQLAECLKQVERDDTIRCLLLTGAGRGFCAGQDLNDRNVDPTGPAPDLGMSVERFYNPLVRRLAKLPKPVICAVNGVAAGAGATLALGGDIVIAARSAKFVMAFSKLGLIPDCGGTWLLPRVAGRARAMGLALLGNQLSAEQAHEWGMIWQVVDDETLADGELLFTTLTKEALPVIRYRTRDLTRLLPGTARTMRRMDRISGRSDDMLIIRGVNVFPSQLEEEIVKFEHLSPHYQLEVNRRGHLDSLSVKVELKESSLTLTHEQRCQVCHQLRHRIKSMVGISTDVMIVNCGSIPRSEGKACRVFDLRNIVGA